MKKAWYIYRNDQNIGQAESLVKAVERVIAESESELKQDIFISHASKQILCGNIVARYETLKV